METVKKPYGAREWASKSINFSSGCSNDCLYCYARGIAVRFKQLTYDEWRQPRIRQKDVDKPQPAYGCRVMFPSSHDIMPDNLGAGRIVLRKLLQAGNDVLFVSKPHLDVIQAICDEFGD